MKRPVGCPPVDALELEAHCISSEPSVVCGIGFTTHYHLLNCRQREAKCQNDRAGDRQSQCTWTLDMSGCDVAEAGYCFNPLSMDSSCPDSASIVGCTRNRSGFDLRNGSDLPMDGEDPRDLNSSVADSRLPNPYQSCTECRSCDWDPTVCFTKRYDGDLPMYAEDLRDTDFYLREQQTEAQRCIPRVSRATAVGTVRQA